MVHKSICGLVYSRVSRAEENERCLSHGTQFQLYSALLGLVRDTSYSPFKIFFKSREKGMKPKYFSSHGQGWMKHSGCEWDTRQMLLLRVVFECRLFQLFLYGVSLTLHLSVTSCRQGSTLSVGGLDGRTAGILLLSLLSFFLLVQTTIRSTCEIVSHCRIISDCLSTLVVSFLFCFSCFCLFHTWAPWIFSLCYRSLTQTKTLRRTQIHFLIFWKGNRLRCTVLKSFEVPLFFPCSTVLSSHLCSTDDPALSHLQIYYLPITMRACSKVILNYASVSSPEDVQQLPQVKTQ